MIKSMTAFGRAEAEYQGRLLSVEVRSFNNRYRDLNLRLPRRYSLFEERIKKLVLERVSRGRVELAVLVNGEREAGQRLDINLELARDYHRLLSRLKEELDIKEEIGLALLLSLKDVIELKEVEEDEQETWAVLQRVVVQGLESMDEMRVREGETLKVDLGQRLADIARMLDEIEARAPQMVAEHRERLRARVEAALGDLELDEARLAQEVAFFADRSDVTEEIVRARSHLDQFAGLLETPEPVGRKLNFLLQELNREVNTIGSKSPDASISQKVVEVKSELERMREQVQNIE